MGYQNVKTPRFYIDYLSYNKAIGNIDISNSSAAISLHTGFNPSGNTYTTTTANGKVWLNLKFTNPMPAPRTDTLNGTSTSSGLFMGCLGHNAASAFETGMAIDATIAYSDGDSSYGSDSQIANWEGHATPVPLNGFTLNKKTDPDGLIDIQDIYFRFYIGSESQQTINLFVKSLVFGQYYDMPVSPDLSLSMSHEYGGIKTITTKGGSTLSNANYHKPAMWGDREAWELQMANDSFSTKHRYSGRRSWDLSFSYIADSDIEPYNYSGIKWSSDTAPSPTPSEDSDNWFTNVLYYTMGGHLPFIFCPDPSIEYFYDTDHLWTAPRTPEFAICRFDMNSFKREQVANSVYNIKVKIVESW